MRNLRRLMMQQSAGGGRLPSGYTELEWIENNGLTWLNTDFCPNPTTTKAELVFSINESVTRPHKLFGCRLNNYNEFDCNIFFMPNNLLRLDCLGDAASSPKNFTIQLKTKYECVIDGDKVTIDGKFFKGIRPKSIEYLDIPLWIFSFNDGRGGNIPCANTNTYSCKIWDNKNLVRDYVPCRSSDDKVGMFDLIERKFYGSETNTPFFPGPEKA